MNNVSLALFTLTLLVALTALAIAIRCFRRFALLRSQFDAFVRESTETVKLLEFVLRSSILDSEVGKPQSASLNKLSFSQHGEDALAWNLLGRAQTGFFIEAGAHDGVSLSNTHFLETIGWTGLLVEAHPELAAKCKTARPNSKVVHAALGPDDGAATCEFQMVLGEGGVDALSFSDATIAHKDRILREGGKIQSVKVPCTSLNKMLTEQQAPRVDFLSLDVEGAEMLVLSGLDFDKWKPRVLAIEDNSNGRDHTIEDYLVEKKYKRVLRLSCNDFYVRCENEATGSRSN